MREAVLERIKPGPSERKRLQEVSVALITRIESMAEGCGLELKAMLVGSAARGTWLAGDHDLDVFLGVGVEDDLEKALELARRISPDHREKYAEHPYIQARIDGFEVDLVPCYLVDDAAHLRSAVDRTPFHNRYVKQRIAGLEDEVLLLKQFMKGSGVYGSELRVGGFSGYLAELLVLCYGSFAAVIEAASLWKPGLKLDLEGRGRVEQADPLVVVDPVDPGRNVAAALTLNRMLQFALAARTFMARPDIEFFFANPPAPLSDREIEALMEERGTLPLLIEFAAPDVVEDVLYPQLRKAESSVNALLERKGFSILRSDVISYGNRAALLLEMEVWRLSPACRREGPPVWQADHISRFLAAHPKILSGPYIKDGRMVVEEERRYAQAADLLAAELASLSLGRHISASIRSGYKIYAGVELLAIKDDGYRIFLAEYFQARCI
ncbi:MAG: CCA tRNA nucleotidyltransferase, partial [Methanothrix sp.]|nr:CCA tRNA nucleotidyltransferase [Methanothrix sp.]